MQRRKARELSMNNIKIGGDAPISVQSMTNTKTTDIKSTIQQIDALEKAGCEIIRVAVPDQSSVDVLADIIEQINIPLVADIHFDYRLALGSIEAGVAGLRINPGNIGNEKRIAQVAKAAKERHIPIRVGSNSGSIEKSILLKYGGPTARAMVESALRNIRILEDNGFYDIIISLKSTDIEMTYQAYKIMAEKVNYPFHIGITEAGTPWSGTIKSAVGIGALLLAGLGDTLRISLTGDPLAEVKVGWQILKSLRLRKKGPEIISCPTCGRTSIELIPLAEKVEKAVSSIDKDITIAVMGCAVNGPGEAREADIGIAGGKGNGLIFKNGEIIKKVPEEQLLSSLLDEIERL